MSEVCACGHRTENHECGSGPCCQTIDDAVKGVMNKAAENGYPYGARDVYICPCMYHTGFEPFVWKGIEYKGGVPDEIMQDVLAECPHSMVEVKRELVH